MKSVVTGLWSLAMFAIAMSGAASAGTFVQPSVSGTSPNGLEWAAVATGTALPVTGTSPAASSPGAVFYYNTLTGQLQFDPKGLSITTFILTYTTGTTNVSGTTPGPFQYTSGTGQSAFSIFNVSERTFPEVQSVSGLSPTTFPARFGITVGAPLGPALAIGGNPYRASTNGFWDLPWAFPLGTAPSGLTIANFKTIGQATNANADKLGWGSQQGVFQYTANGVVGSHVGAVIPVVPEPSTWAIGLCGLVCGGYALVRRRT